MTDGRGMRRGGGQGDGAGALAAALAAAVTAALGGGAGAGCASVSAPGWVQRDRDPASGEARAVMGDVEAGGVALAGYSLGEHAGTLVDVTASHDTILWQGTSEVTLVAGGEAVDVGVTERELESGRDPLIGVMHDERVSMILDDATVAWVIGRATRALEVVIGRTTARVDGEPLETLRAFFAAALQDHGGREGMPPLVPPSDR